jgi:flagellum-specific peptidoglycan hydrolase FlgJ
MASNTVEQIFVELLLNAKGYSKEADDAVKKSEKLEKGLGNTEKQSVKTNKSFDGLVGGLRKAVKGVAGLTAVIAAGTGLLKLADEARKANDELNFLSKNLGMSSGEVKAWQGAAAAMGGSAQGMAGDMKALNSSMNDFVMTGESSMLPMFNTLGVSMVNAQGKVRDTNEVLLDVADSFSKMDREQAALMGQKMGFDEGTINTLLQGRDAMQEMVNYHKQMYTSNKQELEASRKLSENQAKMSAHWDSMKLMMGNAIIPLLVKLSGIALRFFEFLQRHQKTVKAVFEGMAIFLGMLVVPLLGKALVAALLFMAPFLPFIAVVGLLGAAFIALYQDYKVWAEGGESLFNWGAFSGYIDNAKFSTENLGKGFLHLIGDYKSWSEVAEDGKSWLKLKGFIDENGVSLKTLRAGFIDLAGDIVKYAIPTLKGYAEILQKLVNGDFKGAAWQSAQMFQNLGDSIIQGGKDIWNRATESVDITTGQPVGTLSSTSVFNEKSSKGTAFSAKGGSGNKSEFVKKYLPVAQSVSKELDVPVEALLGQWALETGWGKSITKGTGYNLGNIKAGSSWKGGTVRAYDKAEKSNDLYRVYNTPEEFAKDYAALISKNKRYKGALGSDTPREFFTELKKGGYATDPNYVKSGVSVSNSALQEMNPISKGATQAQSTMPKNQIPASIAKPVTNNKSNNVEVNVNKIEVNTSSSTMTGTMGDAIKGLKNNNFYQFSMGPQ